MTLKQKISFVLSEAYPALSQLEDDYFLIGAAALLLSGVNVSETSDIDILTSPRDTDILKSSWAKKLMANHHSAKRTLFRSNFARFDFAMLDIEAMGGLEVKSNKVWTPVSIQDYFLYEDNGFRIKIPTLEEQKRILLLFDRYKDHEKIGLLNSFIKSVQLSSPN